jgi:hypothetical protein
VLAECEAKRQIVKDREEIATLGAIGWEGLSAYNCVLRALALPYIHHKDYDEDW